MLSKELNQRLTSVGPGTPMGTLLRRYWYPVAAAVQLEHEPVRKVRLLGEDLVLYRDRSGNLGLIDEPCPHRRVSMEYGIPEAEGLRCPYHGWLFNHEGRCLEQPAEPWDSTFKDRVTTQAHPVQEFAGMVWAYLGPAPAPLLPRYDIFVWDNVVRQIGATLVPSNWLQIMENSVDPVHVEWLHGYYFNHVLGRKGPEHLKRFGQSYRRHRKIGFVRFEHGIIKRRIVQGDTEEDDPWRVGHPVVFPNILRVGNGRGVHAFQIRVPVDDTHTWHLWYTAYRPGVPVPPQDSVPYYEVPLADETGRLISDHIDGQDMLSWIAPGPITDRENEHLGQSDAGVIMFRQLLLEQLDRVEHGQDPMEVYRQPHDTILLPQERDQGGVLRIPLPGDYQNQARYSPYLDQVRPLFDLAVADAAAGRRLLTFQAPPAIRDGSLDPEHQRDVQLQP
jgi:5,5'-dehydrodivanillate O-demethylase